MSKRFQGGILGAGFNPLKAPNAPTGVTATAGNASASVSFTAPTNVGGSAITGYTVQSSPGSFSSSGSSSPITVSGLTNDTPYTFTVWALNSYGPSPASAPSGSVSPSGLVALFAGGFSVSPTTYYNVIESVSIASLGNAASFGTLSVEGMNWGACGSSTRALFSSGNQQQIVVINVIDYIQYATGGAASDFGDLTQARINTVGASNSTRGLFIGGQVMTSPYPEVNTIDYVTIATPGNTTDFGDLAAVGSSFGALANATRAVAAGYSTTNSAMSYVTIATTGNTTNFGNLTQARITLAGLASDTRGVFGGGFISGTPNRSNVMDYITIASTGNATDFGDLLDRVNGEGGASSTTRGLFAGGYNDVIMVNIINYITIATTGNAADFGDLTAARQNVGGTSNCHGGL